MNEDTETISPDSTQPVVQDSAEVRELPPNTQSKLAEIRDLLARSGNSSLKVGDYLVAWKAELKLDDSAFLDELARRFPNEYSAMYQRYWITSCFGPEHPARKEYKLSYSHLRALMAATDPEVLAKRAHVQKLRVRALEALVSKQKRGELTEPEAPTQAKVRKTARAAAEVACAKCTARTLEEKCVTVSLPDGGPVRLCSTRCALQWLLVQDGGGVIIQGAITRVLK